MNALLMYSIRGDLAYDTQKRDKINHRAGEEIAPQAV